MTQPALRTLRLKHDLTAVHCEPASGAARGRILFLHGMMAGAWQFEHLQPFVAKRGYESLALNYRGHHGSRPVRGRSFGRISVGDYVEDALIAARVLGRPIVVGQSMGGLISQKLAEADAVSAAVFMCSLPPRGILWRGSRELAFANLRALPQVVCGRALVPDRRALDALIFNRVEPGERAAMFDKQVPESSWAASQIALGVVAVDATRVRCPVLSVSAEHDRLIAPSAGATLARKYAGTLLELRDCGHYALVGEHGWEPRAEAILDWLDELHAQEKRT